MDPAGWLGRTVEVVVESPRGSFVKRRADGGVDFVSPLPTPYNYGHVVGEDGGDGDPLDALVVGPRLPAGHRGRYRVHGVIRFVDEGLTDDKLVCGEVDERAWRGVAAFFEVYARFKRVRARLRGRDPDVRVRARLRWDGAGSA